MRSFTPALVAALSLLLAASTAASRAGARPAGRADFWRSLVEEGAGRAAAPPRRAAGAGDEEIARFAARCAPLPPAPAPAADVSSLRPQDIRGVIALGDSITAAFAARGGFEEYRGASWSIGGDPGELTVPNLLSAVAPPSEGPVVGASVGVHLPEICVGTDYCPPGQRRADDRLNAAQSGATAANMLKQAEYIVDAVPEVPGLDLREDWKLATLLIGANDLCDVCGESDSERQSLAEGYESSLRRTLETLRVGIPRLLVNLVAIFDVSEVYRVGERDPHCIARRRVSRVECECALNPGTRNARNRAAMDEVSGTFRDISSRIAADYRDAGYSDFGVALHKFGFRTNFSAWPEWYVSPFDCFHPSMYAHRDLAVALWNSMLTPLANRSETIEMHAEPTCPDEHSRVYV